MGDPFTTEVMRGKTKRNFLTLCFLVLFSGGCQHPSDRSIRTINSHALEQQCLVGRLKFIAVGGSSKDGLRVRRKYFPLEVCLVEGDGVYSVKGKEEEIVHSYVVGIESEEGKALLKVAENAEPWTWQGLREAGVSAIANEVLFSGNLYENDWTVVVLQNERRLKVVLHEIRALLSLR